MTKLLDVDWLRSAQLFHYLYCSVINDFFKRNKMAEKQNLNTNEIVLKETKLLQKIRTKHQILDNSLAGVEYDVYIENYRLQELDKALQNFTLRLVDVVKPVLALVLKLRFFWDVTKLINT